MNKPVMLLLSAAVSALMLTLASPGFDMWFLAYIALVPALVYSAKSERPGFTLWLFGFIYYFINLRWIITSVSHFGNSPFFVGLSAAMGFAAMLALFWAVFGWVYARKKGSSLLLAGILVCLEIIRGNILTGFPWLNLSHTQYTFLPVIQAADLGGEHLISLAVAYFNIALADFFITRNNRSIALASVFLAALLTYGFLAENRKYESDDLSVRIIQPAYKQEDKWDRAKQDDIFLTVSEMLRKSEPEKFDLIMLPESVYPAFLDESFSGYLLMRIMSENTPLIAGGIRNASSDGNIKYYNSVFMLNNDKTDIYDKRHLVPFGEYFPMKTLFKPIDYYFFKGAEDFSAGKDAKIFSAGKLNAAPLVCYESAYSSLVRPQVDNGANILTVATNDSWFGKTQGPSQHLAADVMRAVEFRRYVLRAAQSGISACLAANGDIEGSLKQGKKGYLDCEAKLISTKTVFSSIGYTWFLAFLGLTYGYDRLRRRRNND